MPKGRGLNDSVVMKDADYSGARDILHIDSAGVPLRHREGASQYILY
jgi:hypothetical protein